jgi:hypothetical protein
VTAATLPIRIIDKSLVSDRVMINAVVNKYCDHSMRIPADVGT